VIVYDVLFAEESDEDEELASSIARAGNVVLASVGGGAASQGSSEEPLRFAQVDEPVAPLADAAMALAHANVEPDDDGRVRSVPLVVADSEGNEYLSMSLAALHAQLTLDQPPPQSVRGDSFQVLNHDVPMEDHTALRVNYVGGTDSFATVPFTDVFDGTFDPSLVENKTVFVGINVAAADRHSTPLIGDAPGVVVQLNALDTMLRDRFLQPVGPWLAVVSGIALVGLVALVVPRWRAAIAVLLVVGIIVVYEFAFVFAFFNGWIIDAIDVPAAVAVATVAALAARVVAERAAERDTRQLFGRYVSDDVAKELVLRADRGQLDLGGELREVTVLFGDIRGFTSISQGMDPHDLVAMLNRRFEVIVESVAEYEGILNKFVGDAIMAIWNAPQLQEDHAQRACRAALRIQERLAAIADEGPEIRFGLGINSGLALAGNVGAGQRLEYTVIGEAVNTASRLCGAADGGDVWIGESTRNAIAGAFDVELLPPQNLKNMAEPVIAYRLLGEAPPGGSAREPRARAIEELVT
jgi:adenylate cyclase